MEIKKLSIRSLTIAILLLTGLVAVLVSLVSGDYFFKAAREAQLSSLNRVVQVATKEIMQELRDQTYDISTTFSTRGVIPDEFPKAIKLQDKTEFIKILDDPFITGFVGVYNVELVKIRVYDLNLKFVAESKEGLQGLSEQMPGILYQKAYGREGAARNRAVHGLWRHAGATYYSTLVPIGGIFVQGYLEMVVNPLNNLVELSEKMGSPVSVRSGLNPDVKYYESDESINNLLPIEYILRTEEGEPVFRLISYENIAQLTHDVRATVISTIVIFIGMVLLVLIISVGLFQLFLFKPLNLMLTQMKHITDGNFSHDLQIQGLAEINVLAEEFNKMTREIRSREEELEQLSVIDELTGIANRRKFNEVLKNEYLTGCRTKNPLSLLLIDIDYFKPFNDTYGHPVGDECLKQIATALQDSLYRPTDLAARYGGEEFVIILPYTPNNGEYVVAQKIMDEIARLNIPHKSSGVDTRITVSIGGYTLIPSIHHDPEFVVAEADKSLYQAKKAGRNRFILRNE